MLLLPDCGMCILIWIVQVVVYPSFRFADEHTFSAWHATYARRMALIAGPLMLRQAGAHISEVWSEPNVANGLAALLIAAAWAATAFLSVPCHRALQQRGKDQLQIARLISTNWIRTACWTGVFILTLARSW